MTENLFDSAETWVDGHTALLNLLVSPFVTLLVLPFIAWLVTRMVNSAAEKRARNERKSERELKRQLKISDFRQEWINGLREDLADYTSLTWSAEIQKAEGARKQQVVAQARILMRMNPDDPDYHDLEDSLHHPVADRDQGRDALYVVGQRILKREWERLKDDLRATEQDIK